MTSSSRVLNGSKTRGSTSKPVGVESISGLEFDEQRQGINIRSLSDQTTALFFKIRPNSDEITTINGRDIDEKVFDESISTVNFVSASLDMAGETIEHISNVNLGTPGKLSSRLSHYRENLDLGQTNIYEDGLPYFDTQNINPKHIVTTTPFKIELPPALADHNSMSSLDGVVDIFDSRKKIDRSSLEAPFFSKGPRANFGQIEDTYRRSNELFYGLDIGSSLITESFLDADEYLGITVSNRFYGVIIPGVQSDVFSKVVPFADVDSERHDFYKNSTIDNEVKHTLINASTSSLNNCRTHDKMALTGYRYENNNIGIDSIAFGGLLK